MTPARSPLEGDWFPGGVPTNVEFGDSVYLDSSYSFDALLSHADPALVAGTGTGFYDVASLITSTRGRISIGEFAHINGCTILANDAVTIGDHALLAWSAVVSDSWFDERATVDERRAALRRALRDPARPMPTTGVPDPVVIGRNVWIGFGAIIRPGVHIGDDAVVGARTVVRNDVPAGAVVVGDPAREVRLLDRRDATAHIGVTRRDPPSTAFDREDG